MLQSPHVSQPSPGLPRCPVLPSWKRSSSRSSCEPWRRRAALRRVPGGSFRPEGCDKNMGQKGWGIITNLELSAILGVKYGEIMWNYYNLSQFYDGFMMVKAFLNHHSMDSSIDWIGCHYWISMPLLDKYNPVNPYPVHISYTPIVWSQRCIVSSPLTMVSWRCWIGNNNNRDDWWWWW
jgi:hypothetical protein